MAPGKEAEEAGRAVEQALAGLDPVAEPRVAAVMGGDGATGAEAIRRAREALRAASP